MSGLVALLPLILIGLGLCVGWITESRHLRSLAAREAELDDLVVTNLRRITRPEEVRMTALVMGDAVIATDYFKTFVAGLRQIIGGRVKTYERLMDRARREATVRMLANARRQGATEIWNVRLETSNILSATSRQKSVSVEVFAFGTAVVRG